MPSFEFTYETLRNLGMPGLTVLVLVHIGACVLAWRQTRRKFRANAKHLGDLHDQLDEARSGLGQIAAECDKIRGALIRAIQAIQHSPSFSLGVDERKVGDPHSLRDIVTRRTQTEERLNAALELLERRKEPRG